MGLFSILFTCKLPFNFEFLTEHEKDGGVNDPVERMTKKESL